MNSNLQFLNHLQFESDNFAIMFYERGGNKITLTLYLREIVTAMA